jgi:hypothetical protein
MEMLDGFFVAGTAQQMDRTEYVLSVVRWKLGSSRANKSYTNGG